MRLSAEELKVLVGFLFFLPGCFRYLSRLQHNTTATTWSQRLLLKVLMIYSALCEPEAGAVMNMTSAPSERRGLILSL